MHKQNIGLRTRLMLVVALLVVVIFSGYLAFNYFELRNNLRGELTAVADSTATRLARQLAAPLWSINEQQVNATLESEMSQVELDGVEIVDPVDGRVLFARSRGGVKTGVSLAEQAVIEARQTVITEAGEPIGIAVVHISQAFMHTTLMSALGQRAMELLVLGILLVLSHFLLLQRVLPAGPGRVPEKSIPH